MRTRTLAALCLAALGVVTLAGCHDGYSSIGYSYYGSYGSPCDYTYYPSYSHYDFSYSTGHNHYGGGHGHYGGHGGYHGGHHGHQSHCPPY